MRLSYSKSNQAAMEPCRRHMRSSSSLRVALGEATGKCNVMTGSPMLLSPHSPSSPTSTTSSAFEPDDSIAIYRLLIVKARSQLRGVQAELAAERKVSAELRASLRRLSFTSSSFSSSHHHTDRDTTSLDVDPPSPGLLRCHTQLDRLESQLDSMRLSA